MGKTEPKSLVIVESPNKAKTINKFLGPKYKVESSVGHVRDLPAKKLGIDIEHDFEPEYVVIPGKEKVLTKLRKLAKEAPKVYLAPDPDREGEAIAWHLAQALKLPKTKAARVAFNEITHDAVLSAFAHPGEIDMHRVEAQQARRVLDRLVGYELSPLLWRKIAKGLSAGRVQSVAVKLIVEREREIAGFKPEEFWKVTATVKPQSGAPGEQRSFVAELDTLNGEKVHLTKGDEAQAALAALEGARYAVTELKEREVRNNPLPPFTTSQLQQQASIRLHFSTKRTMMVAQQLYEGVEIGDEGQVGLITYMRTDSVRIAEEAISACRDLIPQKFGAGYLSPEPRHYKARRGAQEAHEAIRPTDVRRAPEQLAKYLSPEQFRLYRLIWNRFVASQMSAARLKVTDAFITAGPGLFRAKGRRVLFPGHFVLSGSPVAMAKVNLNATDEEAEEPAAVAEQDLPPLAVGQPLDLVKLQPSQHFTKPPARYTEASLVRALEREGIGRPSTYATIVSTIQERGYVTQRQRQFYATDLGTLVTEKLVLHFPDVMDVKFTSEMETDLDKIEEGQADSLSVLKEFYALFSADMAKAKEEMTREKGVAEPSGRTCDKCGEPMVYRWSTRGRFLACSAYPKCRNTLPIGEDGQVVEPIKTDEKCEKCGSPMVVKNGRRGRFLACSAYPACRNTLSMDETGKAIRVQTTDQKCEKCGEPMVVKPSKRGPFLACSGYPNCRNAKPLPTGVPCPTEGCSGQLVRRYARGKGAFYGCSRYPDCRYTSRELPGTQPVGPPAAPEAPKPGS